MKKIIITLVTFLIILSAQAQIKQIVRGNIIEKESKLPIAGAVIRIFKDSNLVSGGSADEEGNFRIAHIPLGRININITMIGYDRVVLPNMEVTSAKELILNIEMEEISVKVNEVVITAMDKIKTNNEMATVSARTFNVEEAGRYAGSRSEPARMASNFAGVQGSNDSRSDIVVRGNSPMGVLWRLEGIDIPSPSHFGNTGSTGGPVSILNAKMIGNSDFFTGAFPAEYGNGTAGVFDVRFRNGNNEKNEFTAQLGFVGTEISGEGPIHKKAKSSYLFTYRYSSLQLFESLHIKIGTAAIPHYQDLSFKLNFPLKNNSNLSFFAMGGLSDIKVIMSTLDKPGTDLYLNTNYDQTVKFAMGLLGASYSKSLNSKSYTKIIICQSANGNSNNDYLLFRNPGLFSKIDSTKEANNSYQENRTSVHWFVNYKVNVRTSLKSGIIMNQHSIYSIDSTYNKITNGYTINLKGQETYATFMPYAQLKFKFTEKLTLNAGLNFFYSTINSNTKAINPRLGLRYHINDKTSISFGYGMHSQMMPVYLYFGQNKMSDGSTASINKNVGMYNSHHLVLGYDWSFAKNARIKVETYYQYLNKVPVELKSSSFSILNTGLSNGILYADSMVNKGIAYNYGVEFTLEKFFSDGYFYMATVSLYQSKYQGSDHIWRNTSFNGNYVLNGMIGKEFKIKDKNVFGIGSKITYAGGQLYGPVDTAATLKQSKIVQVDAQRNSLQFKPYFRFDLRLYYKINTSHFTHEIAFDLVNLFDTRNILSLAYGPDPKNANGIIIGNNYQLGFLPPFYYKLDF